MNRGHKSLGFCCEKSQIFRCTVSGILRGFSFKKGQSLWEKSQIFPILPSAKLPTHPQKFSSKIFEKPCFSKQGDGVWSVFDASRRNREPRGLRPLGSRWGTNFLIFQALRAWKYLFSLFREFLVAGSGKISTSEIFPARFARVGTEANFSPFGRENLDLRSRSRSPYGDRILTGRPSVDPDRLTAIEFYLDREVDLRSRGRRPRGFGFWGFCNFFLQNFAKTRSCSRFLAAFGGSRPPITFWGFLNFFEKNSKKWAPEAGFWPQTPELFFGQKRGTPEPTPQKWSFLSSKTSSFLRSFRAPCSASQSMCPFLTFFRLSEKTLAGPFLGPAIHFWGWGLG